MQETNRVSVPGHEGAIFRPPELMAGSYPKCLGDDAADRRRPDLHAGARSRCTTGAARRPAAGAAIAGSQRGPRGERARDRGRTGAQSQPGARFDEMHSPGVQAFFAGIRSGLVFRQAEEGIRMITAFVQFKLPRPVTREEARQTFLGTAPRYRDTPGLLRKYYLLAEDGCTAGGVYLWKSREDAARLYTKAWEEFVRSKYGAPPTVTYFDSPVVVDNTTNEIISDA